MKTLSMKTLRRRLAPAAVVLATAGFVAPVVAAPETYLLDPMHTFPSLEFSHMGISVWRGRFDKTSGTVTLDRAARTGKVDIAIDPASIDFGLDSMHEHAVGPDWFDVQQFPKASYTGTIRFDGDKPSAIDGQLTFRGQTKPVKLTIDGFGCIPHPMLKKQVCGADAQGTMNWAEWGMKHSEYGQGDAGRVTLHIQVEGLKQD